ncbi:MAG: helix-turn-helix domain-containing protein, partial [Candidatus Dadabacteria bacterium]|nr:helix-turn-helix domain-containing protein [Candidatus Dadabacteria bacterium]
MNNSVQNTDFHNFLEALMRFGDYLKSKRKQRNITQEDLARALNVSSVFIHQLETTGEPRRTVTLV